MEQEIVATGRAMEKTLLLVHPGLLSRYDQLDLLGRLRDRVGRPDGIPGAWVLIPSDDQHAAPVLDGTPIPVITPGEWARVPEPWLRNVHRASSGPRRIQARRGAEPLVIDRASLLADLRRLLGELEEDLRERCETAS
jgi:hypothetical protein